MEKLTTAQLTLYSVYRGSKCVFDYGSVVQYLKQYALRYNDVISNNVIPKLNPFIVGDSGSVYVDYFEVKTLFKIVNYIHDLLESMEDIGDFTEESTSFKKGLLKGMDMSLDKFFEEFDDL